MWNTVNPHTSLGSRFTSPWFDSSKAVCDSNLICIRIKKHFKCTNLGIIGADTPRVECFIILQNIWRQLYHVGHSVSLHLVLYPRYCGGRQMAPTIAWVPLWGQISLWMYPQNKKKPKCFWELHNKDHTILRHKRLPYNRGIDSVTDPEWYRWCYERRRIKLLLSKGNLASTSSLCHYIYTSHNTYCSV